MKPTKILVATDLSEGSNIAITRADALAKQFKAELYVCHVLPNLVRNHPLFPEFNQGVLEQLPAFRERAGDLVAARVKEITGRDEDSYTIVIEDGAPHAAVIEAAESVKADLVIIGTRGLTGLERVLVGSTAEQVVRYAHCSVLIVRPGPAKGPVIAATDLSDPAAPALLAGAEWAQVLDQKLIAAHAVEAALNPFHPAFPYGSLLPIPTESELKEVTEAARKQLTNALDAHGVKAEPVLLDGFPGPAIVQAADDEKASLIAMGTAGRTGLKRMALGSVAEFVVRQASCPVLVVRAQEGA